MSERGEKNRCGVVFGFNVARQAVQAWVRTHEFCVKYVPK